MAGNSGSGDLVPVIERIQSIPRTGETELHLMAHFLTRHGARRFYATEKLDGFSMSFGWLDGEFVVSARDRMVSAVECTVFGQACRELDLPGVRVDGAIFQGELCGPGIRGNKMNLDRLRLFIFDVKTEECFLGLDAITALCQRFGLEMVPVLGRHLSITRESVLGLAAAHSTLYADTEREGTVLRAEDGASDPVYGRVSCKVFNPAFHH